MNLYFINRENTIIYLANDENEALSKFVDDMELAGQNIELFNIFCMPLSEKALDRTIILYDVNVGQNITTSFRKCLEEMLKVKNTACLVCILNPKG